MEASSEIQQRNLEITRRGFDAYNRGDLEALIEILHPDVELHADQELVNGGDFRGHDGYIRWNAEWTEAWEEFTIDLRAVDPIGGRYILADTHQAGRGAGSGIEVEMAAYWVFEVADGQVIRMHLYASRERALAAIERWRADAR